MAKTKTTPPLNRKRPQPSLTSPLRRRKQLQLTLTSLHLPFDLVEEILCRLSVKHLLQLCCVCKSWNYLISRDSNFAKKHLRLSTSSHNRHHLTRIPNVYPKKFVVCHYPISSICTSGSTTRRVKQFNYSVTGILNKENYGHRASTCDGIICFKLNESSAVLCNPSIRKFKLLPPLKLPYQLITSYTLGYHCLTNNYKIIAVNETCSRKIEVYVHTLSTDYWRRIPDFLGPDLIPMIKTGIFVNDSVNWLTHESDSRAQYIVSLDLEKETSQKLLLPGVHFTTSYTSTTLGTLRGCLSLLSRKVKFSDVWIMKEYGNENSWTKLLTVPHTVECGFSGYNRALYISENDKVLMECTELGINSLIVYDSINNTFKISKFQNNIGREMVTQEVYVESLISPL